MSQEREQAHARTLGSGESARSESLADDDTVAATGPGSPSGGAKRVGVGSSLGRYLVLDEVGAGAMGVVYAAYDAKLDRKVALKLLGERASEEGQARLEREAQALAQLAHPNVVAVFDVDRHDEQLFVVMEFVEGRTLGKWMREGEGARPWREVLEVFLGAGRGLAAAHAAGLVHRDFKPENVMLGADGRARVMDFGLVRARVQPEGERVPESMGERPVQAMTEAGAVLGTPAYMAPEQFAGKADARSDQFGFCVALYEALYGERPFAGATWGQLLRALEGGELRPAPVGSAVPSWLRTVLERGLASAPEQRWPSMDTLLEALADDPAQRRRKWGVAALLGALVVGVGSSLAWATWNAAPACVGFEDKLAGVWDAEAREEVQSALLGTQLGYASETLARVEAGLDVYTAAWVRARTEACEASQRGEQSGELLDLRMRCLDERLHHTAATVEVLRKADAQVLERATAAVARLPRLARCADLEALKADHPPPEDPKVVMQVVGVDVQLAKAEVLTRAGKYAEGRELAETALASAENIDYEPLRIRAQLGAGFALKSAGAYEDAERYYTQAYGSALGLGMLPEAAKAAIRQVFLLSSGLARYEEARHWARDAEALSRAAGSKELRAAYFGAVAMLAYAEERLTDARELREQGLALTLELQGESSPKYASELMNLGNVLLQMGEYEEAERKLQQALELLRESKGPDHPEVAGNLSNLGALALQTGDMDGARARLEQALASLERALGPEHPRLGVVLHNLAALSAQSKEFAQARAYQEQAMRIDEAALGPTHPRIASSLNNLGNMAADEGKHEEGRAYFERSLALVEQTLGAEHPSVASPLVGLGRTLTELGQPQDAVRVLERALVLRLRVPEAQLELATARMYLARALWASAAEQGPERVRARELNALVVESLEAMGPAGTSTLDKLRAWEQEVGAASP